MFQHYALSSDALTRALLKSKTPTPLDSAERSPDPIVMIIIMIVIIIIVIIMIVIILIVIIMIVIVMIIIIVIPEALRA